MMPVWLMITITHTDHIPTRGTPIIILILTPLREMRGLRGRLRSICF